jgi:hypothetical protein
VKSRQTPSPIGPIPPICPTIPISPPSLDPTEAHRFLKALDFATFDISWEEAVFLDQTIELEQFTPQQEILIRTLMAKYGDRLKNW